MLAAVNIPISSMHMQEGRVSMHLSKVITLCTTLRGQFKGTASAIICILHCCTPQRVHYTIVKVNEEKDLGVLIDCNLKDGMDIVKVKDCKGFGGVD